MKILVENPLDSSGKITGSSSNLFLFFTSQSTFSSHVGVEAFTKQRIKSLTVGHKAVPPVRLQPATPRSQVKHSTTWHYAPHPVVKLDDIPNTSGNSI